MEDPLPRDASAGAATSGPGSYGYDAKLVELLQRKVAAQEREMADLRKGVAVPPRDGVAPPAKLGATHIPVIGTVGSQQAPAGSASQRQEVCGIDVTGLEGKYGAQFAAQNRVTLGSSSLSLVPVPEATPPKATKMHHPSMLSASPWPTTDHELRNLFDHLDHERKGYLDKAVFTSWYSGFENYGAEESATTVRDKLARYRTLGPDKLSYDEFAILMLQVAVR